MRVIVILLSLLLIVAAVSADKIIIKYPQKKTNLVLDVRMTDSVLSLKQKILEQDPQGAAIDDYKLIRGNDYLANERTLYSYGLADGCKVLLLGQPRDLP